MAYVEAESTQYMSVVYDKSLMGSSLKNLMHF